MSLPRVGMKIYSNDWYLKHKLGYDEAARLLADQGVDFVIAQSKHIPMADSAVKSEVTAEEARRYESLDDQALVRALKARGIEYWAASNLFFDPPALERHPDATPVDLNGELAKKTDWYIGICPTHPEHFEDKLAQLERATATLQPDGIFLGFTRFPGFWETWLPDAKRSDQAEYCFCDRCIRTFERATGLTVEGASEQARREWLRGNALPQYRSWKGDHIVSVIRSVRDRLGGRANRVRIMLNTLPFRETDFERAGIEVFGQDWKKLETVVDAFELMAYHQILRRDVSWVGALVDAFKATSDRTAYATLQAEPLYLTGMHAGRGRAEQIPVEEFSRAVKEALAHNADGIVLFTWADFLRQVLVEHDDSRVRAILEAKRDSP